MERPPAPAPDPGEVAELYGAAVELPPTQRAAFLDEACAGRAALRAEVDSLLDAHRLASGFLESPPTVELAGALAEEGVAEGTRIGSYRVLRELGRGGMGAVYLAERADGAFEQQVALKLIHGGFGSAAMLQRFLRERQILARLEHPNIARLLDGGLTEEGSPYFAMELVRGTPLTAYCDSRRLPIGERLALFEQACRAVQHAHANLVVHRDLKPSNMLATDDGTLKLLDFGIAKALSEEVDDGTAPTRGGVYPLTPEYAAPEQLRGEPATTATDVYALGVVLYELLTGCRPRGVRDGAGPGVDEPESLAAAVSRPHATSVGGGPEREVTLAELAARRGTTPPRLRRALAGDLDAIVLQALAADAPRRYPSVEALGEDLSRLRTGQPVRARPATLRYRLDKLVRRHRVAMAAGTAAVLALLAGTAVSLWQARVAARERDAARHQAARAEQAQRFLEGVFLGADPDRAKGAKLTARELLASGAARVDQDLAEQPELRAEMLTLLASVYQQLGLYADAQGLLEKALALREELHDESHPEVAATYRRLGLVHHNAADYAGARPLLERALRLEERRGDPVAIATTLNVLGLLRRAEGDFPEARRLLERAVDLYERHDVPNSPALARSLNNLGLVLGRLRQHRDAASAFERSLAIHRQNEGELSSMVAGSEDNLALALAQVGDLEPARQHIDRAVAIYERLYEQPHRLLANALNSAGWIAAKGGDRQGAVELYRRALAAYEASLGPDHPDLAYTLRNLGVQHTAGGEHREALALYERALAIREKALGPEHLLVASILLDVAEAQRDLGDLAAAEATARRSVLLHRKTRGEAPQTAEALLVQGKIVALSGRAAEAELLLAEALAMRQARLPAGDPAIAEAEAALAQVRSPRRR